jgi:hypothetical protein
LLAKASRLSRFLRLPLPLQGILQHFIRAVKPTEQLSMMFAMLAGRQPAIMPQGDGEIFPENTLWIPSQVIATVSRCPKEFGPIRATRQPQATDFQGRLIVSHFDSHTSSVQSGRSHHFATRTAYQDRLLESDQRFFAIPQMTIPFA